MLDKFEQENDRLRHSYWCMQKNLSYVGTLGDQRYRKEAKGKEIGLIWTDDHAKRYVGMWIRVDLFRQSVLCTLFCTYRVHRCRPRVRRVWGLLPDSV